MFFMQKESLEFLKKFLGSVSPSGFEKEGSQIWIDEAKKFAGDVSVDLHGNSAAVINRGGCPRVMLAGHLDEIGLMTSYIDEGGYIYFREIGGWDPQILPGQRVWILTDKGKIPGVIGKRPVHLLSDEEKKQVVKIENLWIDIGSASTEETKEVVSIGDPIVIAQQVQMLRNNRVVARGMDDKVGAFVVLEVARMLQKLNPKAEVHAVATVQEEVGLRGAKTSTFRIDPKVGIAIDVGFANDFPMVNDDKKKVGVAKIGGGPILSRGPNINPKVFNLLEKTAKEGEIPYQVTGEPRGTGTDANEMKCN
jgi:endoglucanase